MTLAQQAAQVAKNDFFHESSIVSTLCKHSEGIPQIGYWERKDTFCNYLMHSFGSYQGWSII